MSTEIGVSSEFHTPGGGCDGRPAEKADGGDIISDLKPGLLEAGWMPLDIPAPGEEHWLNTALITEIVERPSAEKMKECVWVKRSLVARLSF